MQEFHEIMTILESNIRNIRLCPFAEDSSSIGCIATRVIANEVEKSERKDICKYSLKRNKKVKTLPTKTSVKLTSKSEASFVTDLLFQRLVF